MQTLNLTGNHQPIRKYDREPSTDLEPGEYGDLLVSLETCPIKKEGLFWRLFKLYWKKLAFISLMLIIPGGLWILCLCVIVWLLNWGAEMQAYQQKQFDAWKKKNDIHSE